MGRFFFTGMLMCVLCIACKDDRQDNKAQGLLVKIQAAYHIKVLFQQQGYNGDSTINIDSAIVQSGLDTLRFNFPAGNERVFLITLQGTGIHIPVINDSKNVELYYNYATRRYGFTNSAASTSLQQLGYAQVKLATRARMLKEWVDSAGKRNAEPALVKDSLSLLKNMNRDFFENYRVYADTVKSPAAFMAVYDAVDFGNDTAGLKKFVQRAAKRFPKNTLVQGLAQNVFDYLDAVGNPRMPGDSIPELVLHDDFGGNFSTFSLKGRYVYIDIWATFCDECIKNEELVRKAKQMFPPGKFEAVSIAIDDQKEDWLKIIKANGYTWPQLIDEKMWQGKAFKILRFNAIPYNFLIGPDGRLIAKNIKKDSVIAVIQQVMK